MLFKLIKDYKNNTFSI